MPNIAQRHQLKKKFLINAHVTVIVILVSTFLSYYYIYYNEFKRGFQQRLINLAQTAALSIDAEKHKTLRTRADEKTKSYQEVLAVLRNLKKANPDIKYIYTMRKSDTHNVWEFVVDEDKDPAHIGDKYDVSKYKEMQRAFERPIADSDFTKDHWGTFLSGYAPIVDSSGQAVAIVGIDVADTTLREQQRKMLLGALVIFLVSMGLITFATRRAVNQILDPIKRILAGIEEIKLGNFNYRIQIDSGDEFEDIGETLNGAAEIIADYQTMLVRDLEETKEQKDKIFRVYRDVMFSVTQGKFQLLGETEIAEKASAGEMLEEVKLITREDVSKARESINNCMQGMNFSTREIMHTTLCISEAATNVLKHAERGFMQVRQLPDRLRIVISDFGPGLDFDKLPNMIFLQGFSTKISMGYGFSLIFRFADNIFMFTSNHGTNLVLDFKLSKDVITDETSRNYA